MSEAGTGSACRRRSKWRQIYATFAACLLGMAMGTDLGWTSPMQPLLMTSDNPISKEPLTLESVSWLASINYLGNMLGSLFWGSVSNRLGRKLSMCLVPVPYVVCWVMMLFANSFEMLLVAKFIIGIGDSGTIVNVPIFIAEIAQDDLRGFFVSFFQTFKNLGILFAYLVGTYFLYYGLAIACLVIPFVFLLAFVWLPESPLFFWKNGQTEKAEKSVLWYRGGDVVTTERTLQKYKLFQNIEHSSVTLKALVKTKGNRKSLILGIAIAVSRQTCGISVITTYAVNIFQTSGSAISPFQSAIILASIQLFFSIVSSFLVDRVGRRPLFAGALFIVGVTLTALGVYLFFLEGQTDNPLLNLIPIILLSINLAAYSIGLGPTAFVIKSEIFSPELRSLAMSSLAILTCCLFFIFVKLYPYLKENIGLYGCMWLYGISSILFSIFFTWYMPETRKQPHSVIVKIMNGETLPEDDDNMESVKNFHASQKSTSVEDLKKTYC